MDPFMKKVAIGVGLLIIGIILLIAWLLKDAGGLT